MRPINATEIVKREDFGNLCNKYGLLNKAVEIGVHRGYFSREFLKQWQGAQFFGIDPWDSDYPGYTCQYDGQDRIADYETAIESVKEFKNCSLIKKPSEIAAGLFEDNSIDFIYIDGDHHYKSVWQDLILWTPKIKTGGIIAGHDFNGDWIDDTRTAVIEWAYIHKYRIKVIGGDAASWYCIKEEV